MAMPEFLHQRRELAATTPPDVRVRIRRFSELRS